MVCVVQDKRIKVEMSRLWYTDESIPRIRNWLLWCLSMVVMIPALRQREIHCRRWTPEDQIQILVLSQVHQIHHYIITMQYDFITKGSSLLCNQAIIISSATIFNSPYFIHNYFQHLSSKSFEDSWWIIPLQGSPTDPSVASPPWSYHLLDSPAHIIIHYVS